MKNKNLLYIAGGALLFIAIILSVALAVKEDQDSEQNSLSIDCEEISSWDYLMGDLEKQEECIEEIRESLEESSQRSISNNAQRSSDVLQILNAVSQYTSQPENSLSDLGNIPLCSEQKAVIGSFEVDLAPKLVDDYLVRIPVDPMIGSDFDTGYRICQEDGKVTIDAMFTEGNMTIEVSR